MALVLLLGVATMARAGILPKVMVVIDEKSLGTIATSEIEALAVKALAEKGIETVDQDMVAANLQRMRQALKQAGDGRGASALGREFGADVVLIGEAVVKPSAKRVADSNLRSYQAAVTLRAVRTDNAANLAAVSEDAAVVALEDVSGSARALRTAGTQAIDKLLPLMLAKRDKGTAATGNRDAVPIDITLGGVDQIWKLKAFREQFRGMEELSSVIQKSYAQGLAVFRVSSRLPAEELAEAIVMNPPGELQVQVVEIKAGALTLRAVEVE
jgi:hypothetical protein